MKRLAVIWHSMTGGSQALAMAAAKGASQPEHCHVEHIYADAAGPETLLNNDGYIFVFPENLAAISGVMKAFFDRSYYPCLGQIEGRPYALIICAGSDGSNAARQATRIGTGWRLRAVADPLIICTHAQSPEAILAPKIICTDDLSSARDLGIMMAEAMIMGVF